jgi:hypothetical protein
MHLVKDTAISISEKSVAVSGRDIILNIIGMGGDEYLTVSEAAELLDCGVTTIKNAITRHDLARHNCVEHQLVTLKQVGILPKKTTQAMLLPKDTVKQLVKLINSPGAWEAYNLLWSVTERVVEEVQKPVPVADELFQAVQLLLNSAQENNRKLAQLQQQSTDLLLSAKLSNSQIDTLVRAMGDRLAELKLNARYHGRIMKGLKTTFLPELGNRSTYTFKDIEQRHFEAALQFVQTWNV